MSAHLSLIFSLKSENYVEYLYDISKLGLYITNKKGASNIDDCLIIAPRLFFGVYHVRCQQPFGMHHNLHTMILLRILMIML